MIGKLLSRLKESYTKRLNARIENRRSISIEWLDNDDAIITTSIGSYRGGCTVWRNAETGERCSLTMELWLSDIWTKEKWRREGEQ